MLNPSHLILTRSRSLRRPSQKPREVNKRQRPLRIPNATLFWRVSWHVDVGRGVQRCGVYKIGPIGFRVLALKPGKASSALTAPGQVRNFAAESEAIRVSRSEGSDRTQRTSSATEMAQVQLWAQACSVVDRSSRSSGSREDLLLVC